MRFYDLLATSLSSLTQRLFRTSLTVLGVVIGTMAVVVMLSLGFGMSASMTAQFDNSTLRRVQVYSVPEAAAPGQAPIRMDGSGIAALEQYPGVETVSPIYYQSVELQVGRYSTWMSINGMPNEALQALEVSYESGEPPAPGAPLALVYGGQVNFMFWDEATGESPEINWTESLVFATFIDDMTGMPLGQDDPDGENPSTTPAKRLILPTGGVLSAPESGWSQEASTIFADLDALIKTLQTNFPGVTLSGQTSPSASPARGDFVFNEFQVMAASPADAEALTAALTQDGYVAYAEVEWIRQVQEQALIIQAVLGGIGFISLLVAAIGIANTMLMSVYERTKEIGVMKVLGASLSDIRKLFLIESAAIGFFGGLFGVILSLGISTVINSTLGANMGMVDLDGNPMSLSLITLPLVTAAIAGATLIGMISGFIPAQRATRLSPLDAIRSQ